MVLLSEINEIIVKKRLELFKNIYNNYRELSYWFEIFMFEFKYGNYVSIFSVGMLNIQIYEKILCLIPNLIYKNVIKFIVNFFERCFILLEKMKFSIVMIKCLEIYFMICSNNHPMIVEVIYIYQQGVKISFNILIRNYDLLKRVNKKNNFKIYSLQKIHKYFFEYKFFLLYFKEYNNYKLD